MSDRMKPDDPRHGTTNGYCNLDCRCQPCRDAWAAYCSRRRAERRAAGVPASTPHGVESTYLNWACRCRACRDAMTKAQWKRRHSQVGHTMIRAAILTVAFAAMWLLPVPADAHPDQPGGPTYGSIDNDTPACVTRAEWKKLHTGRHADRPRWYYLRVNLFGRDAHYITWSQDGRDTAYGSVTCWNPRHRIAKVFVHWTGREWGYRVDAKRIVRP